MFKFLKRKKQPTEPPIVRIETEGPWIWVKCIHSPLGYAKITCIAESNSTILIGDIIHSDSLPCNQGYGSLMMNELLKYARECGYTHLYGNLSEVDLDHKERLFHFYQKFGFEITIYPELQGNYFGRIDLELVKEE